jgi:hypothetical protein
LPAGDFTAFERLARLETPEMTHRPHRTRFRHAASRRRQRFAVAALSVAGAATMALLMAQPSAGDSPQVTTVAADNSPAAIGVAQLGPIPATAAPVPTTANTATIAAPTAPATPTPAATPTATQPVSKVLAISFQLQENGYYCGPAATRIAASAHGVGLSQDDAASRLGTTTSGTDSADDTTRVLNAVVSGASYQTRWINGDSATSAEISRLRTDVVHAITGGYAIVANIVGSASDTAGLTYSYDGGHYISVVGYRDSGQTVKIADPANTNGDGSYWMTASALANWIAHRGYSA